MKKEQVEQLSKIHRKDLPGWWSINKDRAHIQVLQTYSLQVLSKLFLSVYSTNLIVNTNASTSIGCYHC